MPSAAASDNNNESTNWMEPHLRKIKAKIEEHPSLDHHLTILEGHLRINKATIALIFGGLLALALASGVASQLICTAVGCLYPAYCSIKALETSHKDDDTQWLTYWVVFASFSVIESVSDIFISWMPFYWLGKCAFLVWCMSPMELNGSVLVYRNIILPIFRQNEEKIDEAVRKGQQKLTEIAEKVLPEKQE